MSYVRKLSVGPNFPDKAVHYQVGRPVIYNRDERRKTHEVSHILESENPQGLTVYEVWIKNMPLNGELVSEVLWKIVPQGMHTVVEYAIDYD